MGFFQDLKEAWESEEDLDSNPKKDIKKIKKKKVKKDIKKIGEEVEFDFIPFTLMIFSGLFLGYRILSVLGSPYALDLFLDLSTIFALAIFIGSISILLKKKKN